MKRLLLSIFSIILIIGKVDAQELTLASGSVSFAKGTVNTEVLTGIIQQKQEELKQRVFKDIVVRNFIDDTIVKNFTTFYYIYNVMKTVTTEKNKTIITQNIMQHSSEFALVYGFTAFGLKAGLKKYSNESLFYQELNKIFSSKSKGVTLIAFKPEDIQTKSYNDGDSLEKLDPFKGGVFNFLIDMTFDALINNASIKSNNLFKDKFGDESELSLWYKNDNEYQKVIEQGGANSTSAKLMHAEIDKVINGVFANNDNSEVLYGFIKNLKAKEQGLTNITEEQYLAMRKILKEAIEIIRLNYDNSVVYKITDFLMAYTLIEYRQEDSKKGVLYVDIESLVSALDQHYNSKSRKSSVASKYWYINPRPFFSIGVNYGAFLNQRNALVKNDSGNTTNLNSMYLASEKIGLKIKFFDRKYTRSYAVGEKFMYHGTEREWIRPQEQKTISDAHFIIYGSGLLYNIVNLKSDKDFNYAVVGTSFGLTFFNGLSSNIGFACPFTDKKFSGKNVYLNLGFDIPIIDYIAAIAKKK